MKRRIFGNPSFIKDNYGVSHISYTLWQGIERIARGVGRAAEIMADMRPMLIPHPWPKGRKNRTEWVIAEFRVGAHRDDDGEPQGGFNLRIELNDFGSVCPPRMGWKTFPDRFLHLLDLTLPLERVVMASCYTLDGFYIGDINSALRIYGSWGLSEVQPYSVITGKTSRFNAILKRRTCSVGFDKKDKRWVGWSHRAASAFGVGHVVKEGYPEASTMPIGFTCETLEDAKRCAAAFAESVS